jgi:hypothetical protein
MTFRIAIVWTLATGVAFGVSAADDAPPKVSVAALGLRIVRPAPDGNEECRAFCWGPGTTVALILSSPDGGLVDLDTDASEVASYTDDQGKDLAKAEVKGGSGPERARFDFMNQISKDGKLCCTEIAAPGVPTRGAKSVIVAGRVALRMAKQQKDFTAGKVVLKVGAKFTVGAVPFTITSVEKPKWGGGMFADESTKPDDNLLAVDLRTTQDAESVARIEFFDSEGRALNAELHTTSSLGGKAITWTYYLKPRVDMAKIVVWRWTDMKKVAVPFRLTVGVGL